MKLKYWNENENLFFFSYLGLKNICFYDNIFEFSIEWVDLDNNLYGNTSVDLLSTLNNKTI